MAQSEYKIDLNTAFPMLHEQQTRTIIGSTAGESPRQGDKPGVAYCHNVMPTDYGMNSIAYLQQIDPFFGLPADENFVDVRVAYGDAKFRIYLAWSDTGNVYVLLTGPVTVWSLIPPTVPSVALPFNPDTVTVSTVNGISYIFYAGLGGFTYNETTNQLDPVSFTGLSIPDIKGMVASSGYLIAYSDEAIAWSSTLDPTDFVPSEVTGAGGGNVADIAGDIIFCTDNSLGILIYTEANVVAGTYTGNALFPFRFKEIEDSKGGITLDRTAYEANSGSQFVFSKAGLQSIKISKATNILPMITDFLAGRRFEDYNEETREYEITDIPETGTMLKKVKYIASRYLVISYGIDTFTHAIVLDTTLDRLGKLKTEHVDVFEYVNLQTEIAKENIAFLKADGTVDVVDFSVTNPNSSGVLICGKLQMTRTRFINLQGVEIENVQLEDSLSVSSQVSLDGKNFTDVLGSQDVHNQNLETFNFRAEGKNHSIVLIGKFNTTTVQVIYFQSSRR